MRTLNLTRKLLPIFLIAIIAQNGRATEAGPFTLPQAELKWSLKTPAEQDIFSRSKNYVGRVQISESSVYQNKQWIEVLKFSTKDLAEGSKASTALCTLLIEQEMGLSGGDSQKDGLQLKSLEIFSSSKGQSCHGRVVDSDPKSILPERHIVLGRFKTDWWGLVWKQSAKNVQPSEMRKIWDQLR